MSLTPEQLRILRHMLGIETPRDRFPAPYRDYYCANPGKPALHELQALGMVRLYSTRDGYEWWCTTDAGRAAAMASHKTIRYSKPRRTYIKWLDIKDCFADLTFREFLTHPDFAASRREA